jgi:succinate-acetate transporter protein
MHAQFVFVVGVVFIFVGSIRLLAGLIEWKDGTTDDTHKADAGFWMIIAGIVITVQSWWPGSVSV